MLMFWKMREETREGAHAMVAEGEVVGGGKAQVLSVAGESSGGREATTPAGASPSPVTTMTHPSTHLINAPINAAIKTHPSSQVRPGPGDR